MLTNPNTLGLFEEEILEIAEMVHEVGGLLYYDGANLNPILGVVRPGDMGFDIVHLNLHKTFATPHGGGGPGAGPVAVGERLVDLLPGPRPVRVGRGYGFATPPRSIGRIHSFHGNALVLLRAWCYIALNGRDGLRRVAQASVLNANWLHERLRGVYDFPYDRPVMHECVVSTATLKRETGVRALDVAKRLLEQGFHAPTVYFPLVVEEALMIEPTETESPETVAAYAEALLAIAAEARARGRGRRGPRRARRAAHDPGRTTRRGARRTPSRCDLRRPPGRGRLRPRPRLPADRRRRARRGASRESQARGGVSWLFRASMRRWYSSSPIAPEANRRARMSSGGSSRR